MKIGIDVGGSHIGIGVVNNNGELLQKQETELNKKEIHNMEKFIENYIIETIEELLKNYKVEKIGVACPGTPQNGNITTMVNLGIQKLEITNILQNKFNLPVSVKNDAKCAAIAEKKYGSLQKYEDAVFLCLGTGIGGSAFIGGKQLIPNRNPGLEIGHMIINKNGPKCNCGKKGCFETYCSMKKLKEKLIKAMQLSTKTTGAELLEQLTKANARIKVNKNENLEAKASPIENAREIINAKENVNKEVKEKISAKQNEGIKEASPIENTREIINAKENVNKDEKVQKIINEYIENLIIGLSNVIDIFEPQAICLGGSFVYFKEILFEPLLQKYETEKYVFNKNDVPKLTLASLGNDAGIIGACQRVSTGTEVFDNVNGAEVFDNKKIY